jgi:hypothetical protein
MIVTLKLIKYSIIMHEPIDGTCYYSDESDDDMPMSDLVVPTNDFKYDEEYGLYMFYAKSYIIFFVQTLILVAWVGKKTRT